MNPRTDRLFFGERQITAAGGTVLQYSVVPSHPNQVGVLSAQGARVPSLILSLLTGSGGATGQHYYQVLTLPALRFVTAPIRVPVSAGDSVHQACWSADGRYAVYVYAGYSDLFIIDHDDLARLPDAGESIRADVPLLAMRAWITTGALRLRREADGTGGLLIKNRIWKGLYRYDPPTQRLALVPDEQWQRAHGPIAVCHAQVQPPPPLLYIDPRSDHLLTGSRQVVTVGPTPLDLRTSPAGHQVAVVSAEGRRQKAFPPFSGPGGTFGQHYLQVFTLPALQPIGVPVRLPLVSGKGFPTLCWSADGHFVVYSTLNYTRFAIVAIPGR